MIFKAFFVYYLNSIIFGIILELSTSITLGMPVVPEVQIT